MNAFRFLTALTLAPLTLTGLFFYPEMSTAQQAVEAAADKKETTTVQFPNTPIPIILLEYERLTGKTIIRDTAIQGKALIIQTTGEMSYAKAADFIEKSLLLNGYALISTHEENQLKIIDFNSGKTPMSEGLPIFTAASQLPESDEIITYIMPVLNISPEAAAKSLSDIVDLHPYGKITPLEKATAVVITENSSVIKRLIELQSHLDVSPTQIISRSFSLERSDAEEVAKALSVILDLDGPGGQNAPNQGGLLGGNTANNAAPPPPSQKPGSSAASTKAKSIKPKIHAILRSNHLLVVATPVDMENIESLIYHLDAPHESSTFMKRRLNYMPVANFLPIAGDALQRGLNKGENQQSQISGGNNAGGTQGGIGGGGAPQQSQRGGPNSAGGAGGGSSSNGSSGSSGSGGANSGSFSGVGLESDPGPQSLVVDKTLLIADSVQNTIIATGPPEHLLIINELLDIMDIRPQQIQISAIIAQLTLGDDFEFGLDVLKTLKTPLLTNPILGPGVGNPGIGNPGIGNPGVGNPGVGNPGVGNPGVGNPPIRNPKVSDGHAGLFKSRTGRAQNLLDINSLDDAASFLPGAQGLTYYGRINSELSVFVSLLEATNRFEVLSRPIVYTVNNRRAIIQAGQRVPVPRSTLSSLNQNVGFNQTVTATIEYENVLLRIEVVPLINDKGEITLQINQSNDNIIGSQLIGGDEIPTIGTQSLSTTVMVDDGGTVLLVGLISEEDNKSESGIPFLINIPILGKVLGSTRESVDRRELLIFIQPRIINNASAHEMVDHDIIENTRVGRSAEAFSTGADSNLTTFESKEFDSPDKRAGFFKRLFKKNKKKN